MKPEDRKRLKQHIEMIVETGGNKMSKIMDAEHNTHGECCWCNPTIEVMPNGNKVIIHNNNISPEEAVMTREIQIGRAHV